ncbi:hypothetical protein AKJ09_05261 [Labilithrix luteola]|uniref:Uncharacterized protein n=1 Tax=Labilithrix luteola TaxID=1391654 RepID=A0A0K1PYL8_9BACT|nr:hypothetical protein AKJ09_05261 [Labilithrix luteola]
MVDRAGEHAAELGLAETLLQRRELLPDFVDDRVVFLGGAELEELLGVVDVTGELVDSLDFLLDVRTLARDRLRLLRVVPEAWGERGVVQALDLFLQFRDVKDAPLAP